MMDLEQQSAPVADTPAPAAPAIPEAPASESHGPDLDKLISQTLDKMEGTEGAPTEADDDGPVARDPATGRFLPKTKAPDGTSEVAADSAERTNTEIPTNATPAPRWTDGHFRGWSKEQRDAFAKLTPEAQDLLMDRVQNTESHYKAKDTEFVQFRKAAEPLVNVIQEKRAYFDGLGMPPEQAVSALINTEATLRYGTFDQKVRLFQKMAEDYGIPIAMQQPDEFAADSTQPGSAVYPVIHDLRAQLSQLQNEVKQYKTAAQSADEARAASVLRDFATSTNADGSPKYPFFEQVRPAMVHAMQSGQARNLAEAYELASKPITEAISAQLKAKEEAKTKAQAEAVAKARKALPVRTSGMSPGGQTKGVDLDALISGALDQSGLH